MAKAVARMMQGGGVGDDLLLRLVADGGVVVLSGAGLSTESGIPDYRGPTGLLRRAQPMTYQAFAASAEARQRYWARSRPSRVTRDVRSPQDRHRTRSRPPCSSTTRWLPAA